MPSQSDACWVQAFAALCCQHREVNKQVRISVRQTSTKIYTLSYGDQSLLLFKAARARVVSVSVLHRIGPNTYSAHDIGAKPAVIRYTLYIYMLIFLPPSLGLQTQSAWGAEVCPVGMSVSSELSSPMGGGILTWPLWSSSFDVFRETMTHMITATITQSTARMMATIIGVVSVPSLLPSLPSFDCVVTATSASTAATESSVAFRGSPPFATASLLNVWTKAFTKSVAAVPAAVSMMFETAASASSAEEKVIA